ncbi:MAG: glycosyltransferase, partial [Chitinispirillaceae bacterium]|nr:glycosyltransferase [Chitinispirillaceae bacterium]
MITDSTRPGSAASIKVNWEGALFAHHSFGMVNRELLRELSSDGRFDLRHVPYGADQFTPGPASKFASLAAIRGGPHVDAALHVRHRWPPDFTPPASGRYILFQPWEFGCLPVEWVEKIPEVASEVWVYTEYLRECYVASGLDEKTVKVVPLGVDPDEFTPSAPPASWLREQTGGRFAFFFNGGITVRKGVDLLVNAFLSEFGAGEPVCLVIKGSLAYKQDLARKVEELACRSDIAKLIYLTREVPPGELPGLYTACDCYVHPCRAEGYGLPVAEAMACGKPVIVTGAGACRDFTDEETAFLIRCSMERLDVWAVNDMKTVGNPFWVLPDMDDLRRLLRYVYDNRQEACERGVRASNAIRTRH